MVVGLDLGMMFGSSCWRDEVFVARLMYGEHSFIGMVLQKFELDPDRDFKLTGSLMG
mgnify:CR=1 FL=1